MLRAQDLGDYFRIPADNRDLNYSVYFSEGQPQLSEMQDYNSHNTHRLSVDELIGLLMKLEIVQHELMLWHEERVA